MIDGCWLQWNVQLYNVTLQDSNPLDESVKAAVPDEQDFKTLLEQFELPLTFDDGIVSAICPAKDDPTWSVNIKRGILSTLQNTMPRFDLTDYRAREVRINSLSYQEFKQIRHLPYNLVTDQRLWWLQSDVTGTCDVKYSFDSLEGKTINIFKSRDLTSCTDRHNVARSIVSAVPYHFPGVSCFPFAHSSNVDAKRLIT